MAPRGCLAWPILCLSLALAGCENMDPAYWIPDNKKKLPGERRDVFPEGVPGVTQGVPPELIRGNPAQQGQDTAAAPLQQPEPPAAEEKPRPRPKKVARPIQPPPEPAAAPQQQQPARQPAPAAAGAWPSPQTQPQPPAASAWPSPPASGTFTR